MALDLIDLDQPLPGQREFISCWLERRPGLTFIVDPGPRSTAGYLVARLRAFGVTRLDWILLTHIHLDHAGGTAEVAAAFPEARVVCHANGRGHLVEPERLWEGSRAVLGGAATVYGEPAPVPAERFAAHDELTGAAFTRAGLAIVPTPGHAPHHLCFRHDGTLFVGEAAGTFIALPDGGRYLRPATPSRFYPAVALDSLDRLLALVPSPARVAFGHHGLAKGRTRELLNDARHQLERWLTVLRHERRPEEQLGDGALGTLLARVQARLLAEDLHYARWAQLPEDIRERELAFTRQSLTGMIGFLDGDEEGGTGLNPLSLPKTPSALSPLRLP
jgi:glyoxylase-like metal-dependent hydrolase (beta-lactamase superfamily II)